MTPDEKVQAVFNHWNTYKGRYKWLSRSGKKMGKWRSCGKLMAHHKRIIRDLLKDYTVEELIKAQTNYALVLLDKDYDKWTYAWNLQEFWTRTRSWNRKEKQFWQFISDFTPEDYMSDRTKRFKKNPTFSEQVGVFYNKALPNKIPSLPKGRCAQRASIDKLKE